MPVTEGYSIVMHLTSFIVIMNELPAIPKASFYSFTIKSYAMKRTFISGESAEKNTTAGFVKLLLTGMMLCCINAGLFSQKTYSGTQAQAILPGADYIRVQEENGFPSFARFETGSEIPEHDFTNWLVGNLRSAQSLELELIGSQRDDLGIDHIRYVQTYKGIPIDQSDFIVHARDGRVYAFNGKLRKISLESTTPVLSEQQALEAAKQHIGAQQFKWESPTWEADLKKRKDDPSATHFPIGKLVISDSKLTGTRLAYVFDISALSPMKEMRVCVDALTGAILYDVPMESNCVAATVNTIFNGNRSISTELYTAEDYRLRDDCSAAVIHVRDWNSEDLTPNPTEIENTTNTWTTMDEIFGGTTLWCTKQAYNYFLNRHSRDSYDDSDGDVSALINALFDCSPPAGCITANNASMSFSGGNMKVGLHDNGVLSNSYATVDIIGH